jgi:hypothetical protein
MQKEDEGAERLFTLFFFREGKKAQKLTEDATTSKKNNTISFSKCVLLICKLFHLFFTPFR